ncbi:MAG: quinolinate synthase NadA [Candidatus Omnitrophica bacterium]|nr:quinolinate synthase NadA [Candidatus Omnitrophota bacterium]
MTCSAAHAEYYSLDEDVVVRRIAELKKRHAQEVLFLVHHYQGQAIVDFADYVGDSLALARYAAGEKERRFIVFCGVMFMAQSACALVSKDQKVILPDVSAGCPLADMGDPSLIEDAWGQLARAIPGQRVIPVTYVNSDIELKAFTGKNGGSACTSSNAGKIFTWALSQGEKIFFFPDRYLGANTAHSLGIGPEEIAVWRPTEALGGNTVEHLKRARVLVWNGYCHVHFRFRPEDIQTIKAEYPDARVVVHGECREEVVRLADGFGSTSFIISYVEQTPPGTVIAVGTEIHLVKRLSARFPEKKIIPLSYSMCPNMFKISLHDLLFCLEHLGRVNVVEIPEATKVGATAALRRMLEISGR